MSYTRDIRWIHLSDLHIGSEENKWMDDTLRKDLVYFLEHDIGRIDFILITGDVINQGKYNDKKISQQAEEFFENLKQITENIVFCIGNHDYNRSDSRYSILRDWQNEKNKIGTEEEYAKRLRPDFQQYVEFCKSVSKDNPIHTQSYIYNNIEDINIIVLNTSVFSGQPILDKRGNIKKDKTEKISVDDNKKLWVSENDFPPIDGINRSCPTIVIGHHPLEMFEDISNQRLNDFIVNLDAKYLCGHIHKNTYSASHDITQYSSAGLFKDKYNSPSFSYNIIKKNANAEIETRHYSYYKNSWIKDVFSNDEECDNSLSCVHVYNSLDDATRDIAKDISDSDFLYFYGLQASSFNTNSAFTGTAIARNEKLDIKVLIANPYNPMVINRIQQIPDYSDVMSEKFNIKWNNIKDEVLGKKRTTFKSMKIKYHDFPLIFRTVITSHHLYFGLYENKDSSESKIYKFNAESEIYNAMKMHFEYTWNTIPGKTPEVIPARYRIFDKENMFCVTPSLVINVTDVCNMKCVYCPEGGENLCKGTNPCDVKYIKLLIQAFKCCIKNNDDAVLRITGGEPFYEDFAQKTVEILKEAKNNQYDKIVLCTNGVNFKDLYNKNRGLFDSIKDILLLKISLDKLNPARFYTITKTRQLEKVKNNIIFAKNKGFKIELNVVATKYNVDDIMDLYEFASKQNLIGIKILTVNDFAGHVNLDEVTDKSTNEKLLEIIKSLQNNKKFTSHTNVFLYDNKGVAMKKFEDQNGCMITIVDHNNTSQSLTPRRVFCEECYSCEHYPTNASTSGVKACATGVMSLTMRQDGMLSFCRLKDGDDNIRGKNKSEIERIVKKQLKLFDRCFLYRNVEEE